MVKYSEFLGSFITIYKEPNSDHSVIKKFPTPAMAYGFLASRGIDIKKEEKEFWWNKD